MEVNLLVAWDGTLREGLERKNLGQGHCSNCGQARKRLFTYFPQNNRLPINEAKKFCNLRCFRAFNL